MAELRLGVNWTKFVGELGLNCPPVLRLASWHVNDPYFGDILEIVWLHRRIGILLYKST
jgi:hypothetical protein